MYQIIRQEDRLDIKTFQRSENYVNFSMLKELDQRLTLNNFSIKFVAEGTEHYSLNRNNYTVNTGEYLLANSKCEGKVLVDSKTVVKGICIDISRDVLSEALSSYISPGTSFPDLALGRFFQTEEFLENKFHVEKTNLGYLLTGISEKLIRNPFDNYSFENEFYFSLAEKIVEDYKLIFDQIYGIKTIKAETRKDLFRKLNKAKELIDYNFHEKLNMKDVAQFSSLSEYHFFRLFKAAFNISPQQYLINKRMERSLELLQSGNYTVSEAAFATGFSDIYSFSRAFKKHFGISPQKYK